MEPATSVLTVFLNSESDARRVLTQVQKTIAADGVQLVGAAVITLRGSGHALQLRVESQTGSMGPDGQAILDSLFPPAVLSLAAVGREAEAAGDHYSRIGVETNLLKEIGENLSPDGAALLVIVRERWLKEIVSMLRPAGIVRFPLQLEEESGTAEWHGTAIAN